MKVLNLYAGIGGNRKLWGTVEVTAIEINPQIAKIYSDFFPNDEMIIGDAHQYLLNHYEEYDFIWGSPPCPTHSKMHKLNSRANVVYPDMGLYQEILLLQHYFKGKWCIENVIGYYEPLIKPQKVQRHYFWANFIITYRNFPVEKTCSVNDRERLGKLFGFGTLDKYEGVDKRLLLRNCVLPELGLHILNCAMGKIENIENFII